MEQLHTVANGQSNEKGNGWAVLRKIWNEIYSSFVGERVRDMNPEVK